MRAFISLSHVLNDSGAMNQLAENGLIAKHMLRNYTREKDVQSGMEENPTADKAADSLLAFKPQQDLFKPRLNF